MLITLSEDWTMITRKKQAARAKSENGQGRKSNEKILGRVEKNRHQVRSKQKVTGFDHSVSVSYIVDNVKESTALGSINVQE